VKQHCDLVVSLPMPGAVESLNAAVAGSIVLYEALRQRSSAEPTVETIDTPDGPGAPAAANDAET
jgi:tRNA C32,U32 (ribose-2'-O)-methylase TrmJ